MLIVMLVERTSIYIKSTPCIIIYMYAIGLARNMSIRERVSAADTSGPGCSVGASKPRLYYVTNCIRGRLLRDCLR